MTRTLLIAVLLFARPLCAADIEVYFSPKGGCTAAIVQEIDSAKRVIRMQAYAFTSDPIAEALIAAAKRGVEVNVCCDARDSHAATFVGPELAEAGVNVFLDAKHPISHSKTIIVDGKTVVTGSFNWSANAEKNLENLLVIRDADLAEKYVANWKAHEAHCAEYVPPPPPKRTKGTK